jgi:AraC family transcriptional regulator
VVEAAAQEFGDRPIRLFDGIALDDRPILEIARKIHAELLQPGLCGRLFAQSMSDALTLQLLRHHSTLGAPEALERLDLPAHRLRAALDYIEAHLCEDLSLEAIARAARLSVFRFARGFRKSMGLPPHQYVIARRIERARELLRTTEEGIGEVSRRVGFSSQSHFTALFTRRCGLPPRRYRQASRG